MASLSDRRTRQTGQQCLPRPCWSEVRLTNLSEDVETVCHLAKHNMLPIALGGSIQGEKELAAQSTLCCSMPCQASRLEDWAALIGYTCKPGCVLVKLPHAWKAKHQSMQRHIAEVMPMAHRCSQLS